MIGGGAGDTLRFDGALSSAASVMFTGPAGALEIATGATLTVSSALNIGSSAVQLDGAGLLLTDAAGVTLAGGTISGLGSLGTGTGLTGYGTVSAPLLNTGLVTASGGTLTLSGGVVGSALAIDTAAGSILSIGGAASGGTARFNGAVGVLQLTSTTVDGSHHLNGFADTIAGLNIGVSSAVPTNWIDLSVIAPSAIQSVTLTGTIIQVTELAGPVFDLALASAPGGTAFSNWGSDGAAGTEVFFSSTAGYHAHGVVDFLAEPGIVGRQRAVNPADHYRAWFLQFRRQQ